MSATVLPFKRPAAKRRVLKSPAGARVVGFAVVLSVRDGAVEMIVDGTKLELTPEQASELGESLIECSADAAGGRV